MAGKDEAGKMPAVDLDALTVPELRALIAAAEVKAREKVEAAQAAVLSEARERLAELGVSLDSLLRPEMSGKGKARRPPEGGKLAVKYRGPEGQEWSGRGKVPVWLVEAEKQGRGRDTFKV